MRRQRAGIRAFFALPALLLGGAGVSSCYSTGDGQPPPLDRFYFPVGLQVSHGGSVLYVANSDFDLQYNGGTLQSYDLTLVRRHALDVIANPATANVPYARPVAPTNGCPDEPTTTTPSGSRQALGETCAPPVRSSFYVRDSAVVGAFATDMLLSPPPVGTRPFDRLFVPVRGNATLTWANVTRDLPTTSPPECADDAACRGNVAAYPPWGIGCGQDPASRRCDSRHQIGEDPDEPGNTRRITMPGEPFGIALSEDARSVVITHQNDTKTSLLLTGLAADDTQTDPERVPPSMQFVLEGVARGGVGVTAIPHDSAAFEPGQALPNPAFLQTSRSVAQLELLRQYPDEAISGYPLEATPSGLRRPFLAREAGFPIPVSASGVDSRGVAIDPTPRLSCKARATTPDETLACARRPARVFIANRSPAALLIGEVGGTNATTGAYDPDVVTIFRSEPLAAGPSKVYLAPIVDRDGAYALRVFVLCFDSATIFIYDPDAGRIENVLRTGPGPSAMAFDPFDMGAVARHEKVPMDERAGVQGRGLRRYRFGYVASFTQSFVQLLDLDNGGDAPSPTFERVVFTLGEPTNPKGT